jgi:hypothetical protein
MSYPLEYPTPCPESRRIADAMLACLPPGVPMPDLCIDPDGETCMDWQRGKDRAVSVSVGATGSLAVAWITDDHEDSAGSLVVEFTGQWPKVLVDIIHLIFPPS